MVTVPILYLALALHFVWDFVLQSNKMATNKSKHFGWLWAHATVYASWGYLTGDPRVFLWLFGTHILIDMITSRITSALWERKHIHYFFVVIGFDQLIHMSSVYMILSMHGFTLT